MASNLVASNPVASNPVVSNPMVSNPMANNPAASNLVANNLVANNLVANNLVANNPADNNPADNNPVIRAVADNPLASPATDLNKHPDKVAKVTLTVHPERKEQDSNPVVNNPAVNNPVVSNPVVSNPVVSNPVVSNPAIRAAAHGLHLTAQDLPMPEEQVAWGSHRQATIPPASSKHLKIPTKPCGTG